MMCVSLCGRVYSVLGMSWSNWLVPSDLCKHYIETGCFRQPMTQTVQLRSPPHLETFKACEPEATHYNLLLYQNQKYHVQQCNNATLCLSKVGAQPPFQFEERRELYLYLCLSVWCCHASSLIWFWGVLLWGVMGGWGELGLSYHTWNLIVSIKGMLSP